MIFDGAVTAESHGLIQSDVRKWIPGFQRYGIHQAKTGAGDFTPRLADNVVRATDVVRGVDLADPPMAFLRAAIFVAEALIEMERAAARTPAAISRETLLRLPDRVSENARGPGVAVEKFLRTELWLGGGDRSGHGDQRADEGSEEAVSGELYDISPLFCW